MSKQYVMVGSYEMIRKNKRWCFREVYINNTKNGLNEKYGAENNMF